MQIPYNQVVDTSEKLIPWRLGFYIGTTKLGKGSSAAQVIPTNAGVENLSAICLTNPVASYLQRFCSLRITWKQFSHEPRKALIGL